MQPIDFLCYRYIEQDIKVTGGQTTDQKTVSLFTIAEAIYGDGRRVQVWVNEMNTKNTWIRMVI